VYPQLPLQAEEREAAAAVTAAQQAVLQLTLSDLKEAAVDFKDKALEFKAAIDKMRRK
jgi:hypothetical protein